ncbi:MAG: 16S rRNA (adenine(1518)-N(6)/adenine(1519)-N(6))-dimethyltransferase RsmA [Myxococcales bacterium]|nr:16S rRNA (adenine(1518)-N(6)/adenine(1519)-N(6))-dimethyltransferase RsmA [Myxococcales bacterium]
MNPTETRAVLDRHGLRPSRERGQNFLCDERVAARLAEAAEVGPQDFVLEIGCGLGLLTRALAVRARRVLALEIDAGLVRAVRAEGLLPEGAELRHEDALAVDLGELLGAEPAPRRLVANLPYAVSSPLLRRILDEATWLVGWSVMVQREVALRLSAETGTRDYGSLSVLHRLSADVEIVRDVAAACFHPIPQVVSTFVRLSPRADAPAPDELLRIERWVRAGFGQRRKTLRNALRGAPNPPAAPDVIDRQLAAHGVGERARAEEVPPELWRELARSATTGTAHGAD